MGEESQQTEVVKQARTFDIRLRLGAWFGRPTVAHDKPPFDQIWDTYRPRVWGLTARLSGSRDSADDLTQEVAIQALRGYDNFRGDADPMTWLFRIAIHTVVRHREKMRMPQGVDGSTLLSELEASESRYLHVAPAEQPETRLLDAEVGAPVRRALDELPDDLRTPLIRRLLHAFALLAHKPV